MDLLRKVFGGPAPVSAPVVIAGGPAPAPVTMKVLAIVHNPHMPAHGNRRIQQVYGWQDPDRLAQGYSEDLRRVSGGYADFRIVERIEVDDFPLKLDGYRYSREAFARAWSAQQFHQPDAVDYLALVREFRLIERVDAGQIDEVWLLGFPYCGYYESIMAGPGAFWCNAPPLAGTEHASRRFVIMGFNYERGIGEMLEDFGHRVESMMHRVYEGRRGPANLWERFTRYDKIAPGQAECGNVHFAPNSQRDYDWGNRTPVRSRADAWLNFPDLSGEPRTMTCADWGGGDIRQHHLWWLARLPKAGGQTDGVSNNWWEYAVDVNRVRG